MKSIACCTPRQTVLDGSEDFVVNLSSLTDLSEAEAAEFLDSNVLTSGMQDLVMQAFDRLSGGPSRGIFKLSESMGGGKTQSMIVAGLLARFPHLAGSLPSISRPKRSSRIMSSRLPDAVRTKMFGFRLAGNLVPALRKTRHRQRSSGQRFSLVRAF